MTDLETQKKRPCYLLVKRGLYYAPDRQGYTAIKDQAGRYRKVDALGLDGVTAIHEDEAGDFSPACWPETKIGHLTRKIERLEAETIALTTYRENLRDECRELLAKTERLEAALTLAANRLDRCALEPEFGTEQSYEWAEWAKEARAALGDSHDQ